MLFRSENRRSVKLRVTLVVVVVILALGGLFAWYRHWSCPYGFRGCLVPCLGTSFKLYADDHDGWYPAGRSTSLESLRLLYDGKYATATQMAGVTGPDEQTKKRLESGGALDESVSKWVYWPGFREDDDDLLSKLLPGHTNTVALLWEKQGDSVRVTG